MQFAIEKKQILLEKMKEYNYRTALMVVSFKKLEETYKSMTKEEKKEYIRLVKIARKETAAEFNMQFNITKNKILMNM